MLARIGVYWRSEVSMTLKGSFNTPSNIPRSDLDFSGEMNFPQGVNVGVYHQLTEKWALLADAGWTDWSQFGVMPATNQSRTRACPGNSGASSGISKSLRRLMRRVVFVSSPGASRDRRA